MIVIFATLFGLTFVLAILECMKKTKNRLKLMIALATYLSFNIWIRGILEFSLTLFIVAILDLEALNIANSGISGVVSSVFMILFLLIVMLLVFKIITYFSKKKTPDYWLKGIIELYDPLKPSSVVVQAYNLSFLFKRLCLALIVTLGSRLGGIIQLLLTITLFIICLLVSALVIRFKSLTNAIIHYIIEVTCLVCFAMRVAYTDIESVQSLLGKSFTTKSLDYAIIITLFTSSTVIITIMLFESFVACKNLNKSRDETYQVGVKKQKYEHKQSDEEEKWRAGTVQQIRQAITRNVETKVIDFDDLDHVKRNESDISDNTISNFYKGQHEETKQSVSSPINLRLYV